MFLLAFRRMQKRPGAKNRLRTAGIFPEGIVLAYSRPIDSRKRTSAFWVQGTKRATLSGVTFRRKEFLGSVRLENHESGRGVKCRAGRLWYDGEKGGGDDKHSDMVCSCVTWSDTVCCWSFVWLVCGFSSYAPIVQKILHRFQKKRPMLIAYKAMARTCANVARRSSQGLVLPHVHM